MTNIALRIHALPPHLLATLDVLAVAGTGLARSHILTALRRLGVTRNAQNRSLDTARITPELEQLVAAELCLHSNGGYACAPSVAEPIVRAAVAAGTYATTAQALLDVSAPLDATAQLTIALLLRDSTAAARVLHQSAHIYATHHPVTKLPTPARDPEVLLALSDEVLARVLEVFVRRALVDWRQPPEHLPLFDGLAATSSGWEQTRAVLAAEYALRDRAADARALLKGNTSPAAAAVLGWCDLIDNDLRGAGQRFVEALPKLQSSPAALRDLTVYFAVVSCFSREDFAGAKQLLAVYGAGFASDWRRVLSSDPRTAADVGALTLTPDDSAVELLSYPLYENNGPFQSFVRLLAHWWAAPTRLDGQRNDITTLQTALHARGYEWLARALAEMLRRIDEAPATPHPLVDAMNSNAPWQRKLAALERLVALAAPPPQRPPVEPQAHTSNTRIAWLLSLGFVHPDIRPIEQKRQRDGTWSKGRPIALKRLYGHDAALSYTPADRAVCACITQSTSRNAHGYPETTYDFNLRRALFALVGHPSVFLADAPDTPVEVVAAEVELEVIHAREGFVLRFCPRLHLGVPYAASLDVEGRVRVVQVPEVLQPYIPVIDERIDVPASERERMAVLLKRLATVVKVRSSAAR